MKKGFSVLLILCVLVQGCAHDGKIQKTSLETELGNAIHAQILRTIPVYGEPALNEYVQTIGHRIAASADRKDLTYRFVILQDDRVYSTFAPGGYVYITTGFFKFLESEIELAGALAYEIAAVQYKDPRLSRMKKSWEMLIKTSSFVAPAFGAIGALSMLGMVLIDAGVTRELTLSKKVKEADKKVLHYLSASGYDPQGFLNVLYRMNDPKSPFRAFLYDYLQQHLVNAERLQKLDAQFRELPMENRNFESGRDTYLSKTETVRHSVVA